MAQLLRFLSVVVPFFDKMVNRKTIVFLKRNVNFLLIGTISSPHAQGDQGEEFHAKWTCKCGTGACTEAM